MTGLGYGCAGDNCPNPVNWLLTHMQPPATLSVCDDHYPVFAIGMLAAELGVDTGGLYDVIRKHVDREAKAAAKAAEAAEAAEAQVGSGPPLPVVAIMAPDGSDTGLTEIGGRLITPPSGGEQS